MTRSEANTVMKNFRRRLAEITLSDRGSQVPYVRGMREMQRIATLELEQVLVEAIGRDETS